MKAIDYDLESGKVIIMDGATGTELERRAVPMHDKVWCAMATLTHPDILRGIHEDYINAGARIVTANTFSTNRSMLEPAGLGSHFEQLNKQAVQLALQARDNTGMVEQVVVAGSMSHQVPVMSGTDQRDTDSLPTPEVARNNFREMSELLATSGVDLILMEMMSDPELANIAIEAALATGLPVWVGFSVRLSDSENLISYAQPKLSAPDMLDRIHLDGVQLAGIMHSNVEATTPAIELLKRHWQGPMMVYPDSGYFKMPHWQFVDIISPDHFITYNQKWIEAGVRVVGGCCGLGIEHIEYLAQSGVA